MAIDTFNILGQEVRIWEQYLNINHYQSNCFFSNYSFLKAMGIHSKCFSFDSCAKNAGSFMLLLDAAPMDGPGDSKADLLYKGAMDGHGAELQPHINCFVPLWMCT